MMSVEKVAVRPELRDYIDYIWIFRSNNGISASVRGLIVPNGKGKIVIPTLSELYSSSESMYNVNQPEVIYFVGIRDTAVSICTPEIRVENIVIELSFKGSFSFIQTPLNELTNKMATFTELYGPEGCVLQEKLFNTPKIHDKVRLVQEFLIKIINRKSKQNIIVDFVINKIASTKGLLKINELQRDTGYSNRYIRTLFDRFIGVSPKRFAEIVRFNEFHTSLITKPNEEYYEKILYDYFFDQSHFIKSFKKFTGLTPKQYSSYDNEFGKIFYQDNI